MLKRMWRRLVRFLRQLWRPPPQPSPRRRGSKKEEEIPTSPLTKGGQRGVETLSLSDTDNAEAKEWYVQGCEQIEAGDFLGAVASFEKALEIKPDFYKAWNTRGAILCDQLGRYEEAIASFDKALKIEADFYKAWYNRGLALSNLGRYKQALASYNKTLQIKPDFHNAWYSRGNALSDLGRYKQALASYNKALQIKPDFHNAWYNRGVALYKLGQYEQALVSFDKTLEIKPDDYETWINRGAILCDQLGRYEEALASFDKALKIKPDFHNAWYNQGVALYKLGRYKDAIASYNKALEIQPDFHIARRNRGRVLHNLERYKQELASLPVVMANPTLTQRGYEGRLLFLQEGLKHCPQDTHPEGWGCLHQEMGNAYYSQGKGQPNYRQYCYKAIKSYNQALITLTEDAFPELHLSVLQDYIKPLFDLEKIAEAEELQRRGTDLLRRLFADKNRADITKKELALKFISFNQLTVDLAIQSGELTKALEVAEADKNSCLTWFLYAWNDQIPKPNWQEIKQLTNPTTAIIYWHISPASITTFLLKHNSQTPILITSTNQPEIASQLQHLQKFEAWVKDWNEQYIDYRSKAKDKHSSSSHSWRLEMEQRLESLRDILNIPAIEQKLKDITQLILIPHRDLHIFPLHALFNQELFTITYLPSAEIGINLKQRQPNLSNRLLSVEDPASQNFDSLKFARIESEAISQMFDNPQRIQSENATKNHVESDLDLLNEYNIFHFAGHGTYNFSDPKKSELVLANEDKLTLEEICKKNLSSYNLVTLSACETAITGNQSITTEYIGLVSGFLSRGVANVVSTLWTVESAASALVMIEFYQRRQLGKPDAVALKEATQWLKALTVQQLKEWYEAFLIKLPVDELRIRDFIEVELYKLGKMKLDNQLYAHPYSWAAFIVTGIS